MRIAYFREFIVLAKYLNFSVAAELLHMTQPGLSRHISMLEKEVGSKLLERDTHKVQLTESGENFLKVVKKIIHDYDAFREDIASLKKERIHIGVPYFGVKEYLSHYVEKFESLNSNVELKYLPAYPDEIIDSLLAGRIDLAILPKIDFPDCDKLVSYDVFDEPIIVLLHRLHPLASNDTLQLTDLKDERFIILRGKYSGSLFAQYVALCREHGFEPEISYDASTVEAAVLRMKPDGGIILLPEHIKEANLSANIKVVDLVNPRYYLTIGIFRRKNNQRSIIQSFIDYYLDQNKQKPGNS